MKIPQRLRNTNEIKTICFISILLSIFFADPARGSDTQDDGILRIGVSPSGFEWVDENDATAALKAWADTVGKEMGLGQVDVELLSGPANELRAALEEHRLDGISVNVPEYMDIGLKAQEIYIPVVGQSPGISYALIVGEDTGISSPENLLGCHLVMGKDRRMSLAQPWLQILMADRNGGSDGLKFQEPTIVENPSKAILQVFFHQADAALVAREAFDLACELNPQLGNRLRVMAESPPFVNAFFFFPYRPNRSQKAEKLKNAILNLDATPGGRQVLTVFKSNRMIKYPVSILDGTIQFVEHYHRVVNGASSSEAQP